MQYKQDKTGMGTVDELSSDINSQYESTVDSSAQASMQKALAIFYKSLDAHEAQKRNIKRPNVSLKKGFIKIVLSLLFLAAVFFVLYLSELSLWYCIFAVIPIVVYGAKKTVVWSVLAYQKYAPARVRRSCVFTPSCSEYMLLAIEKYGLIVGVSKGIRRIFRCHPPHGGTDEP